MRTPLTTAMCAAALTAVLLAGLPQAAAIAETIRCTEIKSVPIVISKPGSYCLKRDLTTKAKTGRLIEIMASYVTIDLNGFALRRRGSPKGSEAAGVYANNRHYVTVRNGIIRGFHRGIQLTGTNAETSSGHLIEDVRLTDNVGQGAIFVVGNHNVVRRNQVNDTNSTLATSYGIWIFSSRNTAVSDNFVSAGNAETGIVGINISNSTLVEVSNNSVMDHSGASGTNAGIQVISSQAVSVIDNRLLNETGSGNFGVRTSSSSGITCVRNIVAGFTTKISGCDFSSGNL